MRKIQRITKIYKWKKFPMFISFVIFFVCFFSHLTYNYDISQFGWSWCLNDRLVLSNHTRSFNFGKTNFTNSKNLKTRRKFFPFINFENPLYFSAKLEVKFGLTFVIARNLIFFANHIQIKIWMGISCKLIQYPKKWNSGTR